MGEQLERKDPERTEQERPNSPTPSPGGRAGKEVSLETPALQKPEVEKAGDEMEELGSSLDGVEGLGALVEMVGNLPVLGSRAGEWASHSGVKEPSVGGATQEPEQGPYVGKKKKRKSEVGDVGEGAGKRVMGAGDSAAAVDPQSSQDSSLPLPLVEMDMTTSTLSLPTEDGGSQGFSGEPETSAPNPNPFPASWGDDLGVIAEGGNRMSLVGCEQGATSGEDLYSSDEGSNFASLSDEMEQGSIG